MSKLLFLAIAMLVTIPQAELFWKTTHGTNGQGEVRIQSNKIKVHVHPAYLDVEEEVEIQTLGTTPAGGDANSLEIFGTFQLPEGAAIIGMLLWNGNDLLKARLKDRSVARQQYEQIVDRDAPPPVVPIDPALIEALGNDRYGISIYPVRQGFARKVRLRYHVPTALSAHGVGMPFFTAFSRAVGGNKNAVTETTFMGSDTTRFMLSTPGGAGNPLSLPSTYLFTSAQELLIKNVSAQKGLAATTHFSSGPFGGQYLKLMIPVPSMVRDALKTFVTAKTRPSITVVVKTGEERRNIDMACLLDVHAPQKCAGLEFKGKAAKPWSTTVDWVIAQGEQKLVHTQTLVPVKSPADSILAILWAADAKSYAEKAESQKGTRYGFVDAASSLLALEEDVMSLADKKRYWETGVPRLAENEIFKTDPETGFIFNAPWFNPNPNLIVTSVGLQEGTPALTARLINGGQGLRLTLPQDAFGAGASSQAVTLVLYGMDGRIVGSWTINPSLGGDLELALPGLKPGLYMLKLEGVGIRMTRSLRIL